MSWNSDGFELLRLVCQQKVLQNVRHFAVLLLEFYVSDQGFHLSASVNENEKRKRLGNPHHRAALKIRTIDRLSPRYQESVTFRKHLLLVQFQRRLQNFADKIP